MQPLGVLGQNRAETRPARIASVPRSAQGNSSSRTVSLPWIATSVNSRKGGRTHQAPASLLRTSLPSHHANDIESSVLSLRLLLWTVNCTFRFRSSHLADPRFRSPQIIPLPCPNNCAICTQGVWNPVAILNAPRLPTVQLPKRNVTFSPFAEIHHFRPEHWYPSPPITPQQLPSQLPVIPHTRAAQTSPRAAQSRRPRESNSRRATQRGSRDYPYVSRSADARGSPSPRSTLPPGFSSGAENPLHYQPPPSVPTPRPDHVFVYPPRRHRSPYHSKRKRKLRRFLRFLRRVFKLGS